MTEITGFSATKTGAKHITVDFVAGYPLAPFEVQWDSGCFLWLDHAAANRLRAELDAALTAHAAARAD